ncbi:MAG TPA: amidohydrolase family protein [Acidimicrobiia bacterium]|nr:amidohydrolase family protein [Acidimicrobiia bacterium]
MTTNGWKVADSDMHIMEPPDLWQRYIDPAWLDVAPVGLSEVRRDMRVQVKDTVLSISTRQRVPRGWTGGVGWRPSQDTSYAHAEDRAWDATSQLEAMDAEGLDAAVLFPSRGLFVLGLDTVDHAGDAPGYEPGLAAAVACAYNDWLHDFCAEEPTRLFGAGLLAPHDVGAAADEVKRVVQDYGFKTVFLHPGCVNGMPWHHPDYDPIWRACEELGVPICFHGGGQNYLRPDYTLEVFDNLMMWHTFGQPLGIMAVIVSFASGGVIQRFPNLRVGLLEGNCGWAPWLLHRLDEHWEWTGPTDAPDLDRAPSEFFRSNCFLSVEADEWPVKYYVDAFGDDNLVFSTDYPHGDSKYPDSVKGFLELPIPDDTKRKILWDNWCRLYDMPV